MSLFAESGLASGLILAAMGLLTGTMLLRTYRNLRRQKKGDAAFQRTLRPQRADRGHNLDAPGDVARWEVQMHETARELSARLDSKLSALQALIADADRAAARLEAALGKSLDVGSKFGAGPPHAGPQPRPATQADAGAIDGRSSSQQHREEIYTLSDYGFDAAEIARRVGSPVGEVELILGLRNQK